MQFHSNIDYLPYKFTPDFPFVDWGENFYSPPSEVGLLHTHNCLEIGCCFQGSGFFLVDNTITSFHANDCSIIFPGQHHIASSHNVDSSLWHFVMIDLNLFIHLLPDETAKEITSLLQNTPAIPNILPPTKYSHICMLIRMIVEQLAYKKQLYKKIVKTLALSLLFCLQELGTSSDSKVTSYKYNTIAPALNYISGSYTEPILISELAKMCNMSESSFRRNFTEIMGISPLEFVHEIRIKVSTQLLREGNYPINQIALMVGYDSLSSFNRQFKKRKGSSPTEWKFQKEKEPIL